MSSNDEKDKGTGKQGETDAAESRAASYKKGQPRSKEMLATVSTDFTHSPIIITDGSSSVQFASKEYPLQGGKHRSTNLHLDNVEVRTPVPPTGIKPPAPIHVCHTFTGSLLHRIKVVCQTGGNDRTVTIEGAKAGPSRSPTIEFDHVEFKPDHAHFPPTHTDSERFANANRRIVSLKIFSVDPQTGQETQVHDCSLAGGGNVEYTINDLHG